MPARQLSFMQRTAIKKTRLPSMPTQNPVKRADAGRWLQPNPMDISCAGMMPTVAMLINLSTVRICASFLRPICMVRMPRRFCRHSLPR